MFKKILIANRGEIACRIVRSARRLGIGTVAVFSEADRGALHAEMADEALLIGPAPAADSYLAIERIVEACRKSGADAVHPGYGFLSERAAFAEAVEAAGLTFIGPNSRAIAAMGDKIQSKRLAAEAGVATVPGHIGVVAGPQEAVAAAREIGYPVMLKASAGGGGKGMRIARSDAELSEAFALAASEARSAFGDARLFLEKFIESPRHIEIQVLADKHGSVIHLGERECSIQRRNQKVVEEAPSPFLDARSRAAMGAQAVNLAKAVGYDSAGTVEFVVGPDRSFYFLEMNTRLQVEHPVTEMVTGIDIVEQMIRVAAGEKLALRQQAVRLDGWAVEARVYAEDPRRDFLPSSGRLTRYREPDAAHENEATVRIDSGVVEGCEIPLFYDPLVAKLVVHAPTRGAAIETMTGSLDRFVIEGIDHNLPFLSAVMAHPRWQSGKLSTGFIAEEFGDRFTPGELDPDLRNRLAAVALSMELLRRERMERLPGRIGGPPPWQEEWVVLLGRARVPLRCLSGLPLSPIELDIVFPGEERPVALASRWAPGEPLWTGTIDGEPLAVHVRRQGTAVRLRWRGFECVARAVSPRVAALSALMPERTREGAARQLVTPMPGRLVSIAVAAGQPVKSGEALAVVEAMKMENVLRAERDGRVAAIRAAPGEILSADAVIMEFET